jgi:hypothetical protein
MTELFDRTPNGGSEWNERGRDICDMFAALTKDFIADLEVEEPVDLRDLQMILNGAIADVILEKLICLRVVPSDSSEEE